MALKWLEERWELLFPALEPLGREQEEQIRLRMSRLRRTGGVSDQG